MEDYFLTPASEETDFGFNSASKNLFDAADADTEADANADADADVRRVSFSLVDFDKKVLWMEGSGRELNKTKAE